MAIKDQPTITLEKYVGYEMENNPTPDNKSIATDDFENTLHRISKIVISATSILLPTSIMIGSIFLFSYLKKSGAPVLIDTAGNVLISLSVAFFVIFGTLTFLIFIPITAKMMAGEKIRALYKPLFRESLDGNLEIGAYSFSYMLFYMPFICMISFFLIYVMTVGTLSPKIYWIFMALSAVSCLAAWSRIHHVGAGYSMTLSSAALTICVSFISFLCVFFLLYILFMIMRTSLEDLEWGIATELFIAIGISALIVMIHWATNMLPINGTVIIGVLTIFFMAFAFFKPGPGYVGGMSLQLLGIGGHLPVTVTIKEAQGSQPSNLETSIHGCLILNTGNTIIVHPMEFEKKEKCRRVIRGMSQNSDHPELLHDALIIPISNVSRISKFTERTSKPLK